LLFKTFADPLRIAKGFLLAEPLICAGICDGLNHEIPDFLLVPMIAAGFIDFQQVPSIEGFFSVSLLFFIMAWITAGKAIGGGDIKLMAAAGFVLGLFGAVGGALSGMVFFLAAYPALRFRAKKQYYAMAPWLGTGCFLAYLLIPIGGIY
jgi:leader peptidase (prepilin peptidase)/N-methyltransferase